MSDNLKAADRRKTMQAIKGKGTKLEKSLFSMLVRMGLKGWQKNVDSIIGKPDVVFIKQRLAVFVDGCFWHGCPYCKRKLPQTNRRYWKCKIDRNMDLSKLYNRRLRADGWIVIRIWEHELKEIVGKQKIKAKIIQELSNIENPSKKSL